MPALDQSPDPAQGRRGRHRRGDAQARDIDSLALAAGNEEVEEHVPGRVREQPAEQRVAAPTQAIEGVRRLDCPAFADVVISRGRRIERTQQPGRMLDQRESASDPLLLARRRVPIMSAASIG